jgi:hypothetical protein
MASEDKYSNLTMVVDRSRNWVQLLPGDLFFAVAGRFSGNDLRILKR